ncbi:Cytochrome oxidase assembly protein ShyY1 [Paractinoplanes atraurantiacus]|uniref:SURF1-like protein n=1 Tax=Paractinoplanes atraurantiacus TaxID=1036182 RepID=A0A285H8V7_9ACTN|nr:SURF1 family protein [Actinoplanes atraurantiacus]SNY31051.1 Cytochrome oxidase assembly protein ShyY1 [Actinoplanes atraurantiacus]
MYRFLLRPRWLAALAFALAAASVMVMLGNWQLRRYEERSAINDRIDAADSVQAVPMTSILSRPTAASASGQAPGKDLAWTKVTVSGRYDTAHEIQARGRTVDGDVGYEIVTPLVLDDGTAVLVDRGWVPAPPGGALAAPTVPAAPTGTVTVVGQLHLSESRPAPIEQRNGRLDTRRISVPKLAHEMPYPVYGAYVLLTEQTPANDAAFTRIPIDHEDAWQNGGYAVQWWLFAVMALFAYGYYARKEARGESKPSSPGAAREPLPAAAQPAGAETRSRDRVEDHDRRKAASGDRVDDYDRRKAASGDRVEEYDRRQAASGDRVEEYDRRQAASGDRVEEYDRKKAAALAATGDRVEEADRKRAAADDGDR